MTAAERTELNRRVSECLGVWGKKHHSCTDSQCGDSTWDHDCGEWIEKIPQEWTRDDIAVRLLKMMAGVAIVLAFLGWFDTLSETEREAVRKAAA